MQCTETTLAFNRYNLLAHALEKGSFNTVWQLRLVTEQSRRYFTSITIALGASYLPQRFHSKKQQRNTFHTWDDYLMLYTQGLHRFIERFRHVLAKTKQKSPTLKDTIRQKCLEYATNTTVVLDYPG